MSWRTSVDNTWVAATASDAAHHVSANWLLRLTSAWVNHSGAKVERPTVTEEAPFCDGGSPLLGVGGWELRDDLDVDLMVSLGFLRAARREGGKDSRKARKRAEQGNSSIRFEQSSFTELYSLGAKSPTNKLKSELDSAKTLITWSKKNRETNRKYAKLSSLEAGQHKRSSLGQGPTMSPITQGRAVIAASLLHAALTCLLCAALTCYPGTVHLRGSGLLAPIKASHGNGRLLDTCFRVFARCTKKKILTLSLRSAVENGSFCC